MKLGQLCVAAKGTDTEVDDGVAGLKPEGKNCDVNLFWLNQDGVVWKIMTYI